jgi:peptidoglycan/LPS O-acetylase OafA/YrhL
LRYSSALDGLRGIAILCVCFCHWHLPHFHGGFYGVDIFFALSGYLITSILLVETDATHTLNFANFYKRRILRLFPALCVLLIVYAVVASWIADYVGYGLDIFLVFFYLSNWSKALGSLHPSVLGHTWSLAVEEQFYLIWPPLLLFLIRKVKPKTFFIITVLLALFFSGERYLLTSTATWERLYHSLDTRIDVILYGCAFAVALRYWEEKTLRIYRNCGVTLLSCFVLLSLLLVGNDRSLVTFQYGLFIVAMCSLTLVAHAVSPDAGLVKTILSNKFLVYFGKRSYGLYLWHLPIITYCKTIDARFMFPIISVMLTLLATELSYRCVERPFLQLKDRIKANRTKADLVPSTAELI